MLALLGTKDALRDNADEPALVPAGPARHVVPPRPVGVFVARRYQGGKRPEARS
jgi:hypothetical protein